MDILGEKLIEASFKGVPFLIQDEGQTEGGRKIAIHEFINTSNRFIEDLGGLSPAFSVVGIVHGQNWRENALNLSNVLNDEGSGRLSMPVLGAVNDVYCSGFTTKANLNQIGIITFNINFLVGLGLAPFVISGTKYDVYEYAENTRYAGFGEVADDSWIDKLPAGFVKLTPSIWIVATDVLGLLTGAKDLETLTRESISRLSKYFSDTDSGDILRIASNIQGNASSLIRSGTLMADSLFSINPQAYGFFQQLSVSLPQDGGSFFELIDLSSSLGGKDFFIDEVIFGDDILNDHFSAEGTEISLWEDTTVDRDKRNRNRSTLVQIFRYQMLVIAFEQASVKDYKTKDEITEVREKLTTTYDNLMRTDVMDAASFLNLWDIRNSIREVRNSVFDVLKDKEQQAYTTTILKDIFRENAQTLTYQLYAERINTTDQLQETAVEVRNLNPDMSMLNFTGDVSVFKTW